MLIGNRNITDIFKIATYCKYFFNKEIFVDLRSKRDNKSDIDSSWHFAHDNSSFDINNESSVNEVYELSKLSKINIFSISIYCGASKKQEFHYGITAVNNASLLCDVGHNNTIILRITGGNPKTNNEKKDALLNFKRWICHAKSLFEKTNRKVIIGIEIHQGQWPENINQATEIISSLELILDESEQKFFGIIDDYANRFISGLGKLDKINEIVSKKTIYNHIKDVSLSLIKSKKSDSNGFQIIGDTNFEYGNTPFEWTMPGKGSVNLQAQISNSLLYSKPPGNLFCYSTEHVPASKSNDEALFIAMTYCKEIFEKIELHEQFIDENNYLTGETIDKNNISITR